MDEVQAILNKLDVERKKNEYKRNAHPRIYKSINLTLQSWYKLIE